LFLNLAGVVLNKQSIIPTFIELGEVL